jgi:ABC-2 type transport system permease protein
MNAPLDVVAAPQRAALGRRRPFYWSVRREIWENHFIFIAPLAVALLVLIAFAIGTVHLPRILSENPKLLTSRNGAAVSPPHGIPFSVAAGAVLVTGMLVGVFYCLGTLYNERRDRSILFWRSLPVSDRVTVLAKASIALLVIPVTIFVITMATQIFMIGLSIFIPLLQGDVVPAFWTQWPFFRMSAILVYGLVTLFLWHAPVYAWFLMVSAWARRAPFLWAVLPPLGICIAEKIAFDSSHVSVMLVNRLVGSFGVAFDGLNQAQLLPVQWSQLSPGNFLATPDLWVGLLCAIGFLGVAIRLRRHRGPL